MVIWIWFLLQFKGYIYLNLTFISKLRALSCQPTPFQALNPQKQNTKEENYKRTDKTFTFKNTCPYEPLLDFLVQSRAEPSCLLVSCLVVWSSGAMTPPPWRCWAPTTTTRKGKNWSIGRTHFHSAYPTGWAESISGNGVCMYVRHHFKDDQ